MGPAILRNHHVLAVHDNARATAFFRDVMGFAPLASPPGWSFLQRDQCMLMLGECQDAMPASALGDHSYVAYLVVDDARALQATMRARGGSAVGDVVDRPWGFREFTVRTPDGHRFTLGERIEVARGPGDGAGFARSWLDAFNAADVDRIMAHYAEDVEHSSPTVVRVLGEASGIVRGKAALRAYFEKALSAAGPGLRYDMLRLHEGVGGVTLVYQRSGGKIVAETFHFDARGLVTRAFVAHAER